MPIYPNVNIYPEDNVELHPSTWNLIVDHDSQFDYRVINCGRDISLTEKRFNLLKAEQEEIEKICDNCNSPDCSINIETTEEYYNEPYIRQKDLTKGTLMLYGSIELYQDIRESVVTYTTCQFCGCSWMTTTKRSLEPKQVGIQKFNST